MTSPALEFSAQPSPSEPYSQTLLLVEKDQYLSNKRKIELEMLQVKLKEIKYRLGLKEGQGTASCRSLTGSEWSWRRRT